MEIMSPQGVNKAVSREAYNIMRTKFLDEVAADILDPAGLVPFDDLTKSPCFASTADFVTHIVYNLNPSARYASWALLLFVHALLQLGGNQWVEVCLASHSDMQERTSAIQAARSDTQSAPAADASASGGRSDPAEAVPDDVDEGEP